MEVRPVDVNLCFDREETPKEIADREKKEREFKASQDADERKLFKELKKKFGSL